jgi:hypothetical protein
VKYEGSKREIGGICQVFGKAALDGLDVAADRLIS